MAALSRLVLSRVELGALLLLVTLSALAVPVVLRLAALGALAVGRTERGDAMFVAMARRSAAQVRDLRAFELLD